MPLIEAVRAVDDVIEKCRFFRVCFTHGRKPAVLFDPADGQPDEVDGKDGRRVIEGVVFEEGGVAQHGRQFCGAFFKQRFFGDVEDDARGAEVLLYACIDEVIAAEIPWA